MAKNYTVIADLSTKTNIENDNLIIVEDNEDTKQTTIEELKKCFLGDYSKSPSQLTFYSTQKIENLLDDFKREMATFASTDKVNSIEKRLAQIIATAGSGQNTEVVDARDGETTLSTRLARDVKYAEDSYIKKSFSKVTGTNVSVDTDKAKLISIHLENMSSNSAVLVFRNKNYLKSNSELNTSDNQIRYTTTGAVYTQLDNTKMDLIFHFNHSVPKGSYYFFANIIFDDTFEDRNFVQFTIGNYNDKSSYQLFHYNQNKNKFKFTTKASFDFIKLTFNSSKFVKNSSVRYNKVMLVNEKDEKCADTHYIPYNITYYTINKGESYKIENDNFDIYCTDSNASVVIEYYDDSVTAEKLQDDINELRSAVLDNRDKCGLIKNYGDYLFFDNSICETPEACRLKSSEKYMRNGINSTELTFQEDKEVNPVFALELDKTIEVIDSVSIVFYIDRTISYYITETQPITIYLCSDNYKEPDMVNYLRVKINKNELVQGWNIIKRNINEFTKVGRPDEHSIKYVKVEISKNAGLDNKKMYLNSVIFNQKMKPTVLLAFDGIYEEGVSYTYPYLAARSFPATILANNRTTFNSSVLAAVENMRATYGWDIGQYGCNPNKELLTKDDNSREQYLALKMAKEWLQANLVYNPISYSAPYGNLRPITIPLLKDFGFKIAKTDAKGYCNFFDPEFDFAIPMTLMSNETTADEIISKIQYAIDNDCCICIYTNNVTEFGDESSAKKVLLEEVVKFILNNSDKVTAMTFSDFYNKCNN